MKDKKKRHFFYIWEAETVKYLHFILKYDRETAVTIVINLHIDCNTGTPAPMCCLR